MLGLGVGYREPALVANLEPHVLQGSETPVSPPRRESAAGSDRDSGDDLSFENLRLALGLPTAAKSSSPMHVPGGSRRLESASGGALGSLPSMPCVREESQLGAFGSSSHHGSSQAISVRTREAHVPRMPDAVFLGRLGF